MTQTSPYHYIAPSAISIKLNTLSDPQNASVGIAPSTRIRVANQIPDSDGNIVDIGYANDLDYKTWRLTSRNAHFADSTIGKDIYMYAMLPLDNDRGSLAYTTATLDILGKVLSPTTVPSASPEGSTPVPDASPSDSTITAPEGFYYIHLATFSYDPTTNTRILTYFDTGILQTQKQQNDTSTGDWLKVFSWNSLKGWLQMIAPFNNILFHGTQGDTINITNILTSAYDWATSIINDFTLATTGWIAKHFLSKSHDDETDYTLTMPSIVLRESAEFGTDEEKGFIPNIKGCKIYWSENGWMVETDYLNVHKKMYAKEVEVSEVTHIGGEQILTSANCIADLVEEVKDNNNNLIGWKVFFLVQDGEGRTVYNNWMIGDQAYCQTFNIAKGATEDFSNKYYWRLVINTGAERKGDDLYNFITLSATDFDESGSMAMSSEYGDIPSTGDHIVQFGFRYGLAERQGATLLSGGGMYRRSIIMWEKIDSYVVPNPRVVLSPDRVDLVVDTFKMIVGGEQKDVSDVVTQTLNGRIIINGDDENEPSLDDTFIATLLEAVYGEEASSHTIADLIGAVYITTQKMFYMLTYEEETQQYSWTEDTDGTLKALYDKYESLDALVSRISDDYCFAEGERKDIERMMADINSRYEHAVLSAEPYADNNVVLNCLDDIIRAFTTIHDDFLSEIGENIPCYFSDAPTKQDDIYVLSFTRHQFLNALTDFEDSLADLNDALLNYTVNNIGTAAAEQAKQDAINYVSEHIDEILDDSTKDTVNKWIADYTQGKFVTNQTFVDYKDGLVQYTTWLDNNVIGGTGLWAKLDKMFAGTRAVEFDSTGNIKNISTSGLVTSKDFNALTTKLTDKDGNILTQASISTWIDQSFSDPINLHRLESNILLSADHIYMQGGDQRLGNYFSLSEGRLVAESVTVNGYVQTKFIDITKSDATKVVYDNIEWLKINSYLNINSDGNEIMLPNDAKYIGSRIIINERSYPPYSRSSKDTTIICEGGQVILGTLKTTDPEDFLYMMEYRGATTLAFRAGYVELLAVPHNPGNSTPANTNKCSWMLINHQCLGINGYDRINQPVLLP